MSGIVNKYFTNKEYYQMALADSYKFPGLPVKDLASIIKVSIELDPGSDTVYKTLEERRKDGDI